MGRSLEKLNCRAWARLSNVETAQGDVRDVGLFELAARGCRAAFYLVHSMIAEKKAYALADREGALNMAAVASAHGLERIIYLGGLGDKNDQRISHHLRSRHEVETILAAGPVSVTNLRAAMILGSGSASFEMLRYLVERLPVMTPPRWVKTPCQPIAIADVLNYLVGVLEVKEGEKVVLLAEMKVPGEAMLTFEITPFADGTTQLTLLSRFLPQGIAGILYWYILYPFHELIFFGMAKAIGHATGKPIHGVPERFTPRIAGSCALT